MIKKKFKKFNKALSCTSYNISKQRDKIILSPKIVKGNLLSYGCLNLTLTIELNEKDLNQYNINWEKITNYDSLSFISENNTLWPRIKLSSTNELIGYVKNENKKQRKYPRENSKFIRFYLGKANHYWCYWFCWI